MHAGRPPRPSRKQNRSLKGQRSRETLWRSIKALPHILYIAVRFERQTPLPRPIAPPIRFQKQGVLQQNLDIANGCNSEANGSPKAKSRKKTANEPEQPCCRVTISRQTWSNKPKQDQSKGKNYFHEQPTLRVHKLRMPRLLHRPKTAFLSLDQLLDQRSDHSPLYCGVGCR